MKIVVAEPSLISGIELLRQQAGWEVVVSNSKEYAQHLPGADALIASRLAKVTAEQIEKAGTLKAIAFPGPGAEFVDLDAATAAGVMAMNLPGESAVAVAEHTMGLMLAMARSIPQAIASTRVGHWEGKAFLGTELRRKTLGVMGLGIIGREVVKRARAFEMRILANDPYVNPETAAALDVTLVSHDEIFKQADYITLHVALTTETMGLLDDAAFDKMKKGVRVINCARGELVDAGALRRAIESGKVAGAALDVLQTEPPDAGEPLLKFDNVFATPHIGGSTSEAQELIGVRVAEHLIEYLKEGLAVNALNVPAMTEEASRAIMPYVQLAERLGTFAAHIAQGNPRLVRLVYFGSLKPQNTHMIRNAGLAGVLSRSMDPKPNVVNALKRAADRGLSYAERFERASGYADSIRLELETDKGITTVEGAIVLNRPRLLAVNGIHCETPLQGHLLYLSIEDVPGVVGHVGSVLGEHKANIATLWLGREDKPQTPGGPLMAVIVVETDNAVSDAVMEQVSADTDVKFARRVEF